MVYLDWASTSPPEPSILSEAASLASECYGNPSSRHGLGAAAKGRLEEARGRLLAALSASGRLVLTSGGTESDAIPMLAVLRSALTARRDGSVKRLRIVTTSIEHAAVYEEALLIKSLGLETVFVAPEADGRVDPAKVGAAVDKDCALVAVMAVNNETGAIQPIAEIAAAIASAADALGRKPPRFHVDAVQALGKTAFDPAASGASSAAYSAHKVRGPRGAGALWLSEAEGGRLEPLSLGGGQENALRPGTESLQGAWAFALAAERATHGFAQRVERARELEARLIAGIGSIQGAAVLPLGRRAGDPRYAPSILSVAFPGLSGEVLARELSDAGIAVSTGSACSNNSRRKGRRVLDAMGLPEKLSLSAIRLSHGELTADSDIDRFLEAAESAYRRLRA